MQFQKGHKINIGRKISLETRKKMSESHKARPSGTLENTGKTKRKLRGKSVNMLKNILFGAGENTDTYAGKTYKLLYENEN